MVSPSKCLAKKVSQSTQTDFISGQGAILLIKPVTHQVSANVGPLMRVWGFSFCGVCPAPLALFGPLWPAFQPIEHVVTVVEPIGERDHFDWQFNECDGEML